MSTVRFEPTFLTSVMVRTCPSARTTEAPTWNEARFSAVACTDTPADLRQEPLSHSWLVNLLISAAGEAGLTSGVAPGFSSAGGGSTGAEPIALSLFG